MPGDRVVAAPTLRPIGAAAREAGPPPCWRCYPIGTDYTGLDQSNFDIGAYRDAVRLHARLDRRNREVRLFNRATVCLRMQSCAAPTVK
jgi:hypothetical protein